MHLPPVQLTLSHFGDFPDDAIRVVVEHDDDRQQAHRGHDDVERRHNGFLLQLFHREFYKN